MFDEIYRIAIESNDFDELKRKLKDPLDKYAIDPLFEAVSGKTPGALALDAAVGRKNGFKGTVAAHLALEGHHDKVEWLRQLDANPTDIAYAYALAGNDEQVEIYRTQHNVDVHAIAQGYARGGHHEQVEIYRIQHGANIKVIAYGYEQGGDRESVLKYDLDLVLELFRDKRAAIKEASGATKEYLHGSFFSPFQNSFTQESDAIDALKLALNGEEVDLNKHLPTLRSGGLGEVLREFIKSGVGSSLAGKEVDTVRDFVQALQEKNSNQAQPSNPSKSSP
ncbi:MAG: hypothetical protein P4L79_08240 [Legionella sp.]|uniref:hypothetical protein n=1 Tax=Legionella sp. TaxID=459 RepID=UPI0028435A73|nr:hypothetical protein [Legionella sp.]